LFNEVAMRVRPPASRFITRAAGVLAPLLPVLFRSRFLSFVPSRFLKKPPAPPQLPGRDWFGPDGPRR
jgi:hypothetical protein